MDQLGVLDAVPGALDGREPLEDVEHGAHRGVADGVDLAGDAGVGGPAGQLGELLTVQQRHPGRAARRWTGRVVGLVGRQQRCRPAAQGAVGEELQPAVAVPT